MGYLTEKEYCELARADDAPNQLSTKQIFEEIFLLNCIPYGFFERFIELLHPATNHFFRKTSKYNYQQCLDLRGIEVGELETFAAYQSHGRIYKSNGTICLSLNRVRRDWTEYLVVVGKVSLEKTCPHYPNLQMLNFVMKHEILVLNHGLEKQADHFIHPNLKQFRVQKAFNDLKEMTDCLDKLHDCRKLTHLYVMLRKFTSAFKGCKQILERFYEDHKNSLGYCELAWEGRIFRIHEGTLCYAPRYNHFIKNYVYELLR